MAGPSNDTPPGSDEDTTTEPPTGSDTAPPSAHDPRDTDHATGEDQAEENITNEPAG